MHFTPLEIAGALLVEVERHGDERGSFARTWCVEEFARHGIAPMVQASASFNRRAGTLRGMHFAWPPASEGKLVRCTRGRVHDVLLDLRPTSPRFLQHRAVVLDAAEQNAIFIPPGVAHGFQSLDDDCEVGYMMTEAYRPELADGVRHDDPCFGIRWPLPVSMIAERDAGYPDFDAEVHRRRFAAR
jgi:dTDP-4-dehydrorhamnose 3,5-epimerase